VDEPGGGRVSAGSRLRGLGLRAGIAGAVIGAGVAIVARAPGGYRGLRQARFAPPTWAFAPAWTAIELALADSTARVIEAEPSAERTAALRAAAANDLLYVAFPIVYFRLRSPLLAAAVTWAQAGAALAQWRATRPVDDRAAGEILPQLAWLALAAPSGTVQALANPDPLLRLPAAFPRLGEPRG
jgi:tryptophan-rich sensory protein